MLSGGGVKNGDDLVWSIEEQTMNEMRTSGFNKTRDRNVFSRLFNAGAKAKCGASKQDGLCLNVGVHSWPVESCTSTYSK